MQETNFKEGAGISMFLDVMEAPIIDTGIR